MNVKIRLLCSLFLLLPGGALAAEPLRVTASDGASMDRFGSDVAASGNLLVVGAPGVDVDGRRDQGAAYVFQRRGKRWVQVAKLLAADGRMDSGFGFDVAVSRNVIVVGAPNAWAAQQPARGAAYVFQRGDGGWQQTAKLVAPGNGPYNGFGAGVAVDDHTIVVGSPNDIVDIGPPWGLDAGAVYVFEGKGRRWNLSARLVPRLSYWMMRFGSAVDISGDRLVGGSPGLADGTGGAFVFERDGDGWSETASFHSLGAGRYPQYGHAVAIDGDHLAIGGPWEDDWYRDIFVSGWIYAAEYSSDGWSASGIGPGAPAFGAEFGLAVDIHGNRAVVGSPGTGRAYLYALPDWTEIDQLSVPAVASGPGHSVALTDKAVMFAWPEANVDGKAEQGAVYIEAF